MFCFNYWGMSIYGLWFILVFKLAIQLGMAWFSRASSRCKGGALFLATFQLFQVHLPVHLPCYDLSPLGSLQAYYIFLLLDW